jgi:rare lipoprotein A
VTFPYRVIKAAVKGTIFVVQGAYELTAGTTKLAYTIGKFTFNVVRAPLDWPLVNEDIETIDNVAPKEAIREGRVKTAPYTVKGKRYYPMSVREAEDYDETGTASWYGYETAGRKGGRMTANGEAFDPNGLTAAPKAPAASHARRESGKWPCLV